MRVMSRARNYMFTINFGDAQVTELIPEEFPEWMTFVVWQLECGDEGTMHYQGYVECSGKRSYAAVQAVPGFEGCHLEVRRGTQGQAIAYCTKDDETRVDGPWRHGEPKQQGRRCDLEDIKVMVDTGKPLVDIWDAHYPSMIRYHRSVKEYKRIKTPKRDWIPQIYVLLGPSGSGKSTTARSMFPSAYWKSPGTIWWDDYDGEEDVIWDEFSGQYPFRELLRILDSTPLSVQTKGGHVQFVARNICFTTNHHPSDWYDFVAIRQDWHTSPLKRRLDEFGEIIVFSPRVEGR